MATTQELLTQLNTTKQAIKTAIVNKGVAMDNVPFTEYAGKIGEIQAGGEAPTINLSYGQTPPADTTKNWIQCSTPTAVQFKRTDSTALNVEDADGFYTMDGFTFVTDSFIYNVYMQNNTKPCYIKKFDRLTGDEISSKSAFSARWTNSDLVNYSLDYWAYCNGNKIFISKYESYSSRTDDDVYMYDMETESVTSVASYSSGTSGENRGRLSGVNVQTDYAIYCAEVITSATPLMYYEKNKYIFIREISYISDLRRAFVYNNRLYYNTTSKLYCYDIALGQAITLDTQPPTDFLKMSTDCNIWQEDEIIYYCNTSFELKWWNVETNESGLIASLPKQGSTGKQISKYSDNELILTDSTMSYVVTLKYLVKNGTLNLAIKNGASLLVDSETLKLYATPRYGYYGDADGTGVRVKAYHYNGTEWVDNYDNSVYSATE